MEQLKTAQMQVMDRIEIFSSRAKVLVSDVKTRSVAAARDPTVQATVGSAAGGTMLLGICGGAFGIAAGGIAGAAVGLPFVLFTFGLSIPISSAIGGCAAGSTGVIVGGTAGFATGGTIGYTGFHWRKEIGQFLNNVFVKMRFARDASRASALTVYTTTQDRLGAMRASIVAQVQHATSTTHHKVSVLTSAGMQTVKDPKAQATAAGATVGGVALGGACGTVGLTTGAIAGGVIGVVPALFTFGLSIPIFAAVGGGAGLCVGTAVGSSAGIVGGGAVGYGVYGKRAEISKGAQYCSSYTKGKVGDLTEFIEAKMRAVKNMFVRSVPVECPAAKIGAASASGTAESVNQSCVSKSHDDRFVASQAPEPRTPSRASPIVKQYAQQITPQRPSNNYSSTYRIAPTFQTKSASPQTISVNGFTKTSSVWIGA